MSLNDTPNSNRLHISIFGKTNVGKSSLINAITNQNIALVSNIAGTTTDPVYKSMEIHGIGPCLFIDTAGFDDTSELGSKRLEITKSILEKTDIAIIVVCDNELSYEDKWFKILKGRNIPTIFIINKIDLIDDLENIRKTIVNKYKLEPIEVSAIKRIGIDKIINQIIRNIPEAYGTDTITGHLVNSNDVVMLVMPQDIQAPKGRLILAQVQTVRDLLDNKCILICCTTDNIEDTLKKLINPPKLIITDSQAFKTVYKKKPDKSLLTSFSVLFAAYKGDIKEYIKGSEAIDRLTEKSKILIAEACTHAPLSEDIGREKIPNMLRKRVGQGIKIDMVSGSDFPQDLTGYDLIIHCGACMFNKKYVLSRIERAKEQNVPITNYGIVIAKITGILDKIVI